MVPCGFGEKVNSVMKLPRIYLKDLFVHMLAGGQSLLLSSRVVSRLLLDGTLKIYLYQISFS